MTTTSPPQPGFIEVRDGRTGRLVCRFNPATREVLVYQRSEERRGTLPRDIERVAQYARLTQGES